MKPLCIGNATAPRLRCSLEWQQWSNGRPPFAATGRLFLICMIAGLALMQSAPDLLGDARSKGDVEQEITDARTWKQVYKLFKRNGRKADGVVAEAFSDRIGYLLSERWSRFSELERLCIDDPDFKRFLLRMISEVIPRKRLIAIVHNARRAAKGGSASPLLGDLIRECELVLKKEAQNGG